MSSAIFVVVFVLVLLTAVEEGRQQFVGLSNSSTLGSSKMKSARVECESRRNAIYAQPRLRRQQNRLSEVVVYTTVAVVYRARQSFKPRLSAKVTPSYQWDQQVDSSDASGLPSPSGSSPTVWQPIAHGAWAQIHVFVEMKRDGRHDKALGNFRIVAWVLETGKVILNDVLGRSCHWGVADGWHGDTAVFRQFAGSEGQLLGFRFCTAEQADECSHFLSRIILAAEGVREEMNALLTGGGEANTRSLSLLQDFGVLPIGQLRGPQAKDKPHAARRVSANSAPERAQPIYPRGSETMLCMSTNSIADCTRNQQSERASSGDVHQVFNFKGIASGFGITGPHLRAEEVDQIDSDAASTPPTDDNQDLEIEGRPNASADIPTGDGPLATAVMEEVEATKIENRISCPYKMRQELHVTYNVEYARYEGLPAAWRALNVQFGLPLEAMPKRAVDGYEAKIPAVLQMMKEYLFACGGASVEGIFRLAPDREECAAAKRAINNGTFSGCGDVNVIANLIKVWFRELPRGIFNMIPEKLIYSVCELTDDAHVLDSINVFPMLHRSLVLWLLDLMVEIIRHEQMNKMSAKNMAIVMAPNLLNIASDNPMVALTKSQKAAEYTLALLSARMHQSDRHAAQKPK